MNYFLCILVLISVSVIAAQKVAVPRPTKMPPPVYQHIGCGETWVSNYTWINSDMTTYFAIVDAAEFTVVATVWESTSSSPACEDGAYVEFAPNTDSKDDDYSYGPQQHYFRSGDSFEFKVNNVNNSKVESFDWMFFNPGAAYPCNFDIKMKQIDVKC
jgi:hypothetical protein